MLDVHAGLWIDIIVDVISTGIDCGWSLLNHGVAKRKSLNLGSLDPIYKRELTKLDVHQEERRWNVWGGMWEVVVYWYQIDGGLY